LSLQTKYWLEPDPYILPRDDDDDDDDDDDESLLLLPPAADTVTIF
jgi:hypothetical protein